MSTDDQINPSMAPETTDAKRREAARLYVEQLRVFYVHAAVFVASMVLIFAVNLVVNLAAGIAGELWAWWSLWALIGWGIGVAIHGIVVRASRSRIAGSAWEDRQIDKILSSGDTRSHG